MGERTIEFVLGFIGGLCGFFGAVIALVIGGIAGLLGSAGASLISNLAYIAMVFSGLGIVGSALVRDKPKLGGILMIISAIGGVVSISFYYSLSSILLLTAGLMGLIKKKTGEEKKENKTVKNEIKKVNWILCLIMSVVFGTLGVDRFLMGKVGTGILKLVTAGGLGIWWIIDVILIATKHKYKNVKWIE